jgi:putative ABC transport system ATP-binding protein
VDEEYWDVKSYTPLLELILSLCYTGSERFFMEPIIKVKNLKVIYNEGQENEFIALNDITLDIYPQEYCILFGPSGCGKSTLLYTMLGVQYISSGDILINGQSSTHFTEAEKSKVASQFFGIVFQNFNLIYSLNVMDNITLPQVFIDVPRKERLEHAEALLTRFGIANRARSLPNNLSGGQQQRVAICRALINDPSILLADEPVGNLDSESAKTVMKTFSEINRKDKKTVVLVTHDANYLPYADRIYYFKDGKLERTVKNENPVIPGSESTKTEAGEPTIEDVSMENLEKLARVHKSVTVTELKAWVLSQYLTEELTSAQMVRFEHLLQALLQGEMSEHEVYNNIITPFAKGGVGLYHITAEKYMHRIISIVHTVSQIKETAAFDTHAKRREVIHLLRRFILSDYTGNIEHKQQLRLDKLIMERTHGEINSQEFVELLGRSFAEDGVGLNHHTAQHLAEKLEIILAELVV